MKILISLIGKEVIGNFRVFKYVNPDKVVHLYSDDTKVHNQNLVNTIENSYNCKVESFDVGGFDYDSCLQKLHLLNINADDEIISNISGGTKIMSLALYAFAHEINQAENVCYFDTNQNLHWLNKKTKDSVTTEILLEEYIELQGQKITSKINFEDALLKFKKVIKFIKYHHTSESWKVFLKDVVTPFRKYRDSKNNEQSIIKIISNELVSTKSFKLSFDDGKFLAKHNDVIFLRSTLSEADVDFFFFNAGWFELLTASELKKKYSPQNIYLSVKFPYLSNQSTEKNEVDILINDNGKLIFIECKSGDVKSEHIDRIKNRRDTFGGLISKSILITKYPLETSSNPLLSKNIVEKCREYGIEYKTLFDLSK
ncbi:Card1-like endonuclease domain-containing protein [Cellulophaga sp. BC115SP]|uniref:Card1-like endonuclease domain-containing protein n=1 Tax=Cellulophaga sp. BC115SP TaxID=2683263 RepID=UPI001411D95E|nr:DUF1887 family CARF protein [Cellulophaga sp. BC115SP]NBB31244.1 DUF1887 family protein [Cellulophaga sp. BC115SP]